MAESKPAAPPAPPPPAVGSKRRKIGVLVVAAVIIIALVAVAAVFLFGGSPPPQLDKVEVSAARTTIFQKEQIPVAATAIDTAGGNQTANATFAWTASPASRVKIVPSTGAQVGVTGVENGTVTVTANATWKGVSKTGALTITIEVILDRVEVSAPRTTIDQREELSLTATALDTNDLDQTANATFSWTATPSSRVQMSGSAASRNVIAIAAGLVTITASATWKGLTRTGALTLTIGALSFEGNPSTATPPVNQPFDLDVRVVRADSTTATTYRGTVNFTSDDTTATLPANATFGATDNGMRTFAGLRVGQARAVVITIRDTIADIVATVTVTGQRLPNAPVASFNATRNLMQVSVDASGSRDPDNDIGTYAWAWGDTQTTVPSASTTASHTYTNPGKYTIVLTVADLTSATDVTTRDVSVSTSTIDYMYYDFFNVPYGEWWDYRFASYGDLPINADCFNVTAIANGVCVAANPSIPDFKTYPYTNWYPLPGTLQFNGANSLVYAPYRMNIVGASVPGYNRSEPVFLPTLNYSQPAGNLLEFRWTMNYLDTATGTALRDDPVDPCPGVDPAAYDGFYIFSQVDLTMDLQQSRRTFGVVATDPTSARSWWAANTNALCGIQGTAERNVQSWFLAMGGISRAPGKYNIANGFEWYYVSYFLDIDVTVDADGTTDVTIRHAAWGTELVLARMFYWGNASYLDNYLDSTKARGWWGMELGWFEDFTFGGDLGGPSQGFNFTLSSVLQYHFQHLATAGSNGVYDQNDDVPYWTWGPILNDYTNNYFPLHPQSELDRYPTATYVHSTPGSKFYGDALSYDLAPIRWDLKAGETWHFQFPTGNVMFYDPNLTPSPADPQGSYIEAPGPLKFDSTKPANLGFWDAAKLAWDAFGPTTTGGPPGSPGLDATPGTADDQYALESWGAIRLVDPPLQSAFVHGFDIAADPAEEIAAGEVTSDVQFISLTGNSFQAYPAARVSAFPGRSRKS